MGTFVRPLNFLNTTETLYLDIKYNLKYVGNVYT